MKRILLFLLAAAMLASAGCQNKKEEATSQTDSVMELPETAASETETSAAEKPEEPAASEPPSSEEQDTTGTAVETEAQVPASGEPGETDAFQGTETDTALLGTWAYQDGFRLRFEEDHHMIMYVNYTDAMHFENGFLVVGDLQCAVAADAEKVTATYDGETILDMRPAEGTVSMSLEGLYRLESCYVLDAVAAAEDAEYYILLDGDAVFLGTAGSYEAADGSMQLCSAGDVLLLTYELDGNELRITDEDAQTDILTRLSD